MFHVFKHELRLIFRDPKFWIPFVIPPVILAASQGIAVSRYGDLVEQCGISVERISADWKGDTIQPFATNEDNRVCICVSK